MKYKFNLETLIKMPIIADPMDHISPDGCGCAFGILYASRKNVKLDFTPLISIRKNIVAASNMDSIKFKKELKEQDPDLYNLVIKFENALLGRNIGTKQFTDEEFKKEFITALVKAGYVETSTSNTDCLAQV